MVGNDIDLPPFQFLPQNNSMNDEIKKAIPREVLFLKRKREDDHSSDSKSLYEVENDIDLPPFQFLPQNNSKNDSTLHKTKNGTQLSLINDILNKMQLT